MHKLQWSVKFSFIFFYSVTPTSHIECNVLQSKVQKHTSLSVADHSSLPSVGAAPLVYSMFAIVFEIQRLNLVNRSARTMYFNAFHYTAWYSTDLLHN